MAASKVTPDSMTQLIKGDRSMLMMPDDNVMMKQIQGTHNPDGREIDVKPILHIVVDILSCATMPVETSIVLGMGVQGHMEHFKKKGQQAYKCQIGMDGHQITISLFTVLSNYSWDAKLVLALAAYASNFGAFWLLAQMYTSNQLAKSMALLKRLPVTVEHSGPVKSRFDALSTLITAMLDLTRCIVALKDLPSSYVTQEVPALSAAIATIPTAVHWTVRGIVACATQITSLTSLTSMGYEFITSATEAWELSSLAHKINSIHDHLKKQLELCYQLEKRNPNAIHMMWIWGSNAFPFTSAREEALWREETWKIELLVNGIDQTILNWVRSGKYIFLYGGDDLEWIRRFTTRATTVARDARIPLEMVYVGNSSKREQVRRVIQTVNNDKMGVAWQEPMIWFFWTRLESMLFSKIQLGRVDDYNPMMQEIKKLLSYDKSGGWAVLCRGSEVVVNGHGTTVLPTLVEYEDIWKINVPTNGFDKSFKDHHHKLHRITHPCCRFEFPSVAGRIPESMKCPECLRVMEKHITFICCHDESATTNTSVLY
ncbi:unnamed protein product [Camellia sinensis]